MKMEIDVIVWVLCLGFKLHGSIKSQCAKCDASAITIRY